MKNIYLKNAYPIFLTFLLLISLVTLPLNYYNIKVHPFVIFLASFLLSILIRLASNYKRQPILYVFIFGFFIILGIIIYQKRVDFISEYKQYITWIAENKQDIAETSLKFQGLSLVMILLIIIIPVYLLQNNIYTRAVTAFLLSVTLVVMGILQLEVSKLLIIGILPYALTVLTELFYQSIHKDKTSTFRALSHLIPIYVIVFMIIALCPTKKEPLEWKLVRRIWKDVNSMTREMGAHINLWFHPEEADYEVLFTGYSEKSSFRGNVYDSQEEVLTLHLSRMVEGGTYLRGNIKNEYTGDSWTDEKREFTNSYKLKEYQADTIQLCYELLRYSLTDSELDLGRFIRSQTATIRFKDIFTKTLFIPGKSFFIDARENYLFSNDNIKFNKLRGEGAEYTINFFEMNLGSDDYITFLRNAGMKSNVISKDDKMELMEEFKNIFIFQDFSNLNIEELIEEYQTYVNQYYLHLPKTVTNRVTSLSEEITSSYTSDYEKCKAIETYLKNSFTYTMTPNWNSENSDVVDCFLFEEKRGYCTHFATAFSIMARIVGIPTRYNQGFYISSDSKIDKRTYLVTQQSAHAWPEAYIKGVGWVPFEPTPSSQVEAYLPWVLKDKEEVASQSPPNYDSLITNDRLKEIEAMDEGGTSSLDNENKKEGFRYGSSIFATLLIVSVSCIIVFFILKIVKRRLRYQRADITTKIQMDMMELLNLLDGLGYRRTPDETIKEYFERICDCRYLKKDRIPILVNAYMKMRYHNEIMAIEIAEEFHNMKKHIWLTMKETMGKTYYIITYFKMLIFYA